METFTSRRAYEQALAAPFEAQAAQAARPDLETALQRATNAEEREARAQLATLTDRLAEADATLSASEQLLAIAQAAYDRAGDTPTRDVIERLRIRQREAAEAQAAVTATKRQIAEAEARILSLSNREEQERKRRLAAEVWTPTVAKLQPIVRDLLAALAEQRAARNALVDAQAWGFVPEGTELSLTGQRGEDNLTWALTNWLTAAGKVSVPVAAPSRNAKR